MESSAVGSRPVTYRDVFRNGTWMRLWAGQTVSQLGDFVADIAFPLLIFELTRSAVGLGFAFAIEMLPIIVIGPIAGVFADRINRRLLLLGVDLVRVFCALGIFFSTSIWQLYVLALIAAIMQAIFLAAYSSIIPQITEDQYVKSISLSHIGYRAMKIIGPMVAAILIGLLHGPRPVFLVDAATFAVAFVLTLTIRVGDVVTDGTKQRFFDDMIAGARFLGKNMVVRFLTGYNTILSTATAAATLSTVLYIKTALGLPSTTSDQLYGVTGAILAGTVAFVTWLISMLDNRVQKRYLILWGPILTGTAYLLFLLRPEPIMMLAIFFVVSIGDACALVPVLAFLAKAVPNDLRGRVYSFINALDSVASLSAFLVFSAVGLLLPAQFSLALIGVILLIGMPLCIVTLRGNRALREFELASQ